MGEIEILPSADPLAAVRELMADMHRRIGEEELKTRQLCDRLKTYDDEDGIREEWRKFRMRVAPMQQEVVRLGDAIARASNYWHPPAIQLAQDKLDQSPSA